MKRFVNTADLDKTEWLRARKMGITGTDAGAIVGMNPYKSSFSVYQEKVTPEVEADVDNERMREGRDLEEYVARRFTEQTGLKTKRALAIFQNNAHPLLLADFDRLIIGQRAGLECKTVSPYASNQWANGKIPAHYLMQVQHYLAVSGFECWYVAAVIFGRDFIIHKIDRDEEIIQNLIIIEERFWKEHVMAHVMPDPDGTKSCSEQIAKLYFKADKEKIVELHGYNGILNRREELVELIEKMKNEKETIDQKIKLEMQDASKALAEKYQIVWSSYNSSQPPARPEYG